MSLELAKWVARLMSEDGITPDVLDRLDEQGRMELASVYMLEVAKKIDLIKSAYATSPKVRGAIQNFVFNSL